ncbi:hypothetical protein BDR22DRAFT_870394 [Usnea florida]
MASPSNIPLSNNGTAIAAPQGQPCLSNRVPSETLDADFSTTDLNDIHSHLWIAGSKGNISPLHHQRVLLRKIIPSEQARLHLVWFDRIIYVKPLPENFLEINRYPDSSFDSSGFLLGFLSSYRSLISNPIDLVIAKKSLLISEDVTWEQWVAFRDAIIHKTKDYHINKRYGYGELRLNRLDIIYRLTGRGLTYFTVHRNYKTYFAQYFSLFVTVFAFAAVILAAMQVLVAIEDIPEAVVVT